MSAKFYKRSVIILFVITPIIFLAQEPVTDSNVWYSKLLRIWFGNKITINNRKYNLGKVKCLDKDITNFDARVGRLDYLDYSFNIEGNVSLDTCNIDIDKYHDLDYNLLIQGYLFSPAGKVLWKKSKKPEYLNLTNSVKIDFNLEGSYADNITGNYAAIFLMLEKLNFDNDIIILGMKRYSFNNNNISSKYDHSDIKNEVENERNKYYNTQGNGYFEVGDIVEIPSNSYISDNYSDLLEILEWADKGEVAVVKTLITEKDGVRLVTIQKEGRVSEVRSRIIEVDNNFWVRKSRTREK